MSKRIAEACTAEGTPWRYDDTAPRGQKVLLLQKGGTAVIGIWQGALGEYFLGWQPLPKRNKAVESLLFKPVQR